MNLKELLGEAYKEDMTLADIETALTGKKLADLSTGRYVDKNKYDTDVEKLRNSLTDKTNELQSKMTEDEKKAAEDANKDNLIVQLQEQVKEQQIENNRNKTIATIAESKTLLDIKDGDKEYETFLNSLAKGESEDTNIVATYFNTMIKNAYEKGKSDSVKDKLGKMGNQKSDAGKKQEKENGEFGKNLAKSVAGNRSDFSYFGKYNK